jgi:hypothetical protein
MAERPRVPLAAQLGSSRGAGTQGFMISTPLSRSAREFRLRRNSWHRSPVHTLSHSDGEFPRCENSWHRSPGHTASHTPTAETRCRTQRLNETGVTLSRSAGEFQLRRNSWPVAVADAVLLFWLSTLALLGSPPWLSWRSSRDMCEVTAYSAQRTGFPAGRELRVRGTEGHIPGH